MKPVEFPQQTMVLAKDQPQYEPFPVHFDNQLGACIGCFELTDEERAAIAAGGKLWLWQYTFGRPFQPVALTTDNPWPSAPQSTDCGTCGERIQPDAMTGTKCACTPQVAGGGENEPFYAKTDIDEGSHTLVPGDGDDALEALSEIAALLNCPCTLDDIEEAIESLRRVAQQEAG